MESHVKNSLQKHLKGVAGATLENLASLLKPVPSDRILIVLDLGTGLTAISLRVAMEFFIAAPEAARLLNPSELRVWGEIGKRLAATSPDAAVQFFQISSKILSCVSPAYRLRALTLISRQAALSTTLALDCFRTFPEILAGLKDVPLTAQILDICYDISHHSVKHSCDFLRSAPLVFSHLEQFGDDARKLSVQILELTVSFVHRSGGTAAEFFTSIPECITERTRPSWPDLFEFTYAFLDKSGGVALQYFRAASKILSIADRHAFELWTKLSLAVTSQGNATGYHFLKVSPKILAALARYGDAEKNSSVVNSILDTVIEIGRASTTSAVECFKAAPFALRAASLEQFREWAMNGLRLYGKDSRRAQAYYALESNGSRAALYNSEGGVSLNAVSQVLRLYIEGLTGRDMIIKPIGEMSGEFKIGDGRTIFLPASISEFEDESPNFKLYKALAAHAAGQIEFGTYIENTPALEAAKTEAAMRFDGRAPKSAKGSDNGVDFKTILSIFPEQDLAKRIFTSIENGRIDRHLRKNYRGLRRDLDFVRKKLAESRPRFEQLPDELLPFEMLFQASIMGEIDPAARNAFQMIADEIDKIFAQYVNENSSVADTLMATLEFYDVLEKLKQTEELDMDEKDSDENESDQSEGSGAGEQAETDAEQQRSITSVTEPFSYWTPADNQLMTSSEEVFNALAADAETNEQGLEEGDKAFYYDEWDRDLGDYRTKWCRVIERKNQHGSRSFVESVRSRFAGVISSVRHQFQMMRPENLRKIIGELDGEDFDFQAVIDYMIDRRSSGRISERIYTRNLRRRRDVVVSFLLDMSSSTARTISRYPNQPYTKPGQRIIDIEKEGLVLMSEALEAVGDGYSIQGFTSEGRRNVKFYVIKDFEERYSVEVEKRIGGVTYQNNTRLGAAIRHAVARLEKQEARTKLLIVLSDGRPYDHDYGDSKYAREDTKIALRQGKTAGVIPFCITIDRESEDQLKDLYGEVGYTIIDNVMSLPERMPGIYRKLTS